MYKAEKHICFLILTYFHNNYDEESFSMKLKLCLKFFSTVNRQRVRL